MSFPAPTPAPNRSTTRRRLAASCLLLSAALGASAPALRAQTFAESLQTDATVSRVTARLDGERARVELEGRRLVDVALGRDAAISSLVASGDRWLLAGSRVAVDGRRRLAIVAGDDQGWREIPAPGGLRARARNDAVLLGDPDGLDLRSELTLAWLEGDGSQRQSVYAARFEGDRFLEPERIAGPGPGSQVGLRGVVLTDGTPLLIWNAFDGVDNEIVWSWRRGGVWSAPERIGEDNQVPDVAPTLLATESGAIAAWSRYDGRRYRVVLSSLESGGWTSPTPLSAPGSMPARLLADRGGALLLLQETSPRRWSVVRLGPEPGGGLRPARRASAASARVDAPLVLLPDRDSVELEWPTVPRGNDLVRRASPVVVAPWQTTTPRAERGAR